MTMRTIRVQLGDASHDAHVGTDILDDLGELARAGGLKPGTCAIVTDSTVEALYSARVEGALGKAGFAPVVISVPPGEASQTLEMLELLYGRMKAADRCRHC